MKKVIGCETVVFFFLISVVKKYKKIMLFLLIE